MSTNQIGVTPISTDFLYYGTREVRLVKDGFEYAHRDAADAAALVMRFHRWISSPKTLFPANSAINESSPTSCVHR